MAYLVVQGKMGDLEATRILSLLTPAPVMDLTNILDSLKKAPAQSRESALPSTTSPPAPITSAPTPLPDFSQSLLVWVNKQAPEKWDQLARAFHLTLITAQVAPPRFPYQDLLAPWTMFDALPRTDALTQAIMQFLNSEPGVKSYMSARTTPDAAQQRNQQFGQKSRQFSGFVQWLCT